MTPEELQEMQNLIKTMEAELHDAKEHLEFLEFENNGLSMQLQKAKNRNLKTARRIVEHDSKPVANIILNMDFGKTPADSVSFCEIFQLRGENDCCPEGFDTCTDCINAFLQNYYKNAEREESDIDQQ